MRRQNSGGVRAVAAAAVAIMSAHVPMQAPVTDTYRAPEQYRGQRMPRAHAQYVPPKVNDGRVHIFQPRREVSQPNGGPYTVQNNNGCRGPRAWQRPSQKYGRPDVRLFRQELGALPELMHSEDPLNAVDRELGKEAVGLPRTMDEAERQAMGLEVQLSPQSHGDEELEFVSIPIELCAPTRDPRTIEWRMAQALGPEGEEE